MEDKIPLCSAESAPLQSFCFLLYFCRFSISLPGLTCTTVGEEKQHNPRLTKPKEEFIALMAGLGLPYPKKIDESLPANMVCGLQDLPERMKDWV